MKKIKIYLSGPMTGLPDLNFPAFHKEAERLRGLGYEVVNPAELHREGDMKSECLRRDIVELLECDTVALLCGWKDSEGALLEVHIAQQLCLTVVRAMDITGRLK
ncbi:hypothetical protein AGMMS50256_38950 [Betaproteobacteria bacterium]|nr:hypothetical protein AGMMS50256_38950 [Betaproteobacteria bacterium]